MRLPRLLIVILALMVSPVAAAVCEVACGVVPDGAHHAPAAPVEVAASEHDAHAHHGHHPAPSSDTVVVSSEATDGVTVSLSAPECDLRAAPPARLRAPFADSTFSVAAITSATVLSADSRYVSPLSVAAAPSPPASPPHAPVPLRI